MSWHSSGIWSSKLGVEVPVVVVNVDVVVVVVIDEVLVDGNADVVVVTSEDVVNDESVVEVVDVVEVVVKVVVASQATIPMVARRNNKSSKVFFIASLPFQSM